MKRRIIPYNPRLRAYAKKLRKDMTLAEVLLWNQLKQKKILGCDFDRQRPIDEYIVDFYCKDLCLAIEVDGRSHDYKKEQDEVRQKRLESLGVRFLRFWEYEVKNDIRSVLTRIENWIRPNESVERHPTHPQPLQGGEPYTAKARDPRSPLGRGSRGGFMKPLCPTTPRPDL